MNYIEYYDENLDTIFEIPEFDMSGYIEIEDFLTQNEALVQVAVFSALHSAAEFGLDEIPVFAVKESDSVVSLARDQFGEKLASCLEYFAHMEEYELCTVLINIKKKI
jgi:hypothetical protein